ncbi:hypothetical protein C369_07454 [Cryptococcus neoformans A5-35-17]|nr:hypothetical protein C369_07454 [Cryptococcus neoformans var. grubii A5-35-17]
MKALTVNRVGDMFLSVGFFAIFWVFGAMAKSANIPLHTWLPDAMEG